MYQHEKTQLSKSLEYFLASTQWFLPDANNGMDELVAIIEKTKEKKNVSETVEAEKAKPRKKSRKWIWGFAATAVICLIAGLICFLNSQDKNGSNGWGYFFIRKNGFDRRLRKNLKLDGFGYR